ncbi:Uncharacterised protein [Listeria newyorkensis]|nr:Uncharacterised protein [Listeria newyorkensis]
MTNTSNNKPTPSHRTPSEFREDVAPKSVTPGMFPPPPPQKPSTTQK